MTHVRKVAVNDQNSELFMSGSGLIREKNKKQDQDVKIKHGWCVVPVVDSPAQCSSVQPDCRPRFSPVAVSPVKPHVHFFFSTEVNQRK